MTKTLKSWLVIVEVMAPTYRKYYYNRGSHDQMTKKHALRMRAFF